ncbi:sulfurtransferase-like selenium metabolism protein YedF [Sulfurospirillum arcachonense]|uniref:sulfurtransferase-like selenium metabolism protein YedF n=1 Tax=Sulfurospirillum arcachonense TaxID=57666 RepID=UPI0004686ABE|nr:sulfurtransferase-like selenium metabolism protein YedF [Sulfurospirillum arcachonense]
MRTIDCRDMPVPKPVVLTKTTLDELPKDSVITVIVNCDMSEDNILTYAQNKGYFVKREQKRAGIFITISKKFSCDIDEHHKKEKQIENRAIIITSDCIGRGLHGDSLMQEFLDSILFQKTLPSKLIFLNKGVKLTCAKTENNSIKTLKKVEDKGVDILVSLTSLEELDMHKQHQIGTQISMYELVETMINYETSTI